MSPKTYNYLAEYMSRLQSSGKYSFSWSELARAFDCTDLAVKKSLHRQIRKGRLIALQREFYLVVPPEYSAKGILPPLLFIDDYMSFLQRPYYVGVLSAAAMHGAAHQQPQEFYIVIQKPPKRRLSKKGVHLNFLVKNKLPVNGIVQKKTDTGSIKVSGPELTAYDLVYYLERTGGIVRCLSVLQELADTLDKYNLVSLASEKSAMAPWQRLGYILEFVFNKTEAADALFDQLSARIHYRFPLDPGKEKLGFASANRWKIIQNRIIEAEI